MILLADDVILEGSESFRLRIVAARFSGQAAALFRAQDELTNTFADVNIADDDGKFRNSACTICLQIAMKWPRAYVYPSHALFSSVVRVNWTISRPITVTEGDNVTVSLSGEAFGLYANPIAIGVICAEVIATDVEPGKDTITSTDTRMLLVWIVLATTLSLAACSHPWQRLQLYSWNRASLHRYCYLSNQIT